MESFVVQVWVPSGEMPDGAALRGLVRHVGTGVETPFHGDAEVLRLLRGRRVAPPVAERPRPG